MTKRGRFTLTLENYSIKTSNQFSFWVDFCFFPLGILNAARVGKKGR